MKLLRQDRSLLPLSALLLCAVLMCMHTLASAHGGHGAHAAHARHAGMDPALLAPLAGDDPDARAEAVAKIGALATPEASTILKALQDETMFVTPEGGIYIVDGEHAVDAATGHEVAMPESLDAIVVNNRLRGALQSAMAGFDLLSADASARMSAVQALQTQGAEPAQLPILRKALSVENDPNVKEVLQSLVATASLKDPDPVVRKAAVTSLADTSNAAVRPLLQAIVDDKMEPDAGVRRAAVASLDALDTRIARTELVGNIFYGVSLGSVLLLAALGLAITFGLMGIINMAHGELLMIGAYTTFVCQALFRQYLPGSVDAYLLVAIPSAFLVAAGVGIALERSVIRWLYGRPLETLLATWGISLILMQTVRTVFGAQNVEVANPAWMSGGVTVLGSLVLPYNRIAIIAFAVLVVAALWAILNKTRLGLFVRAVMQNRRMADCVGVPTGRIDMMAFGLGSGIAGLGGVALSQLGNVGPDLGQSYIVDSFMVVVLGGVGQLAGTVIAAFGLGEANKFLEPMYGAVLAKISILVFIIIFIQRRPQGLFALKGRSVD